MLWHHYTSPDTPRDTSQEPGKLLRENVLSVVTFNGRAAPEATAGIINTGLETLSQPLNEHWETDLPVTRGVDGRCRWSRTDEVLCASIEVPLAGDLLREGPLQTVYGTAYRELMAFVHRAGYPHPFRFWNYLDGINRGTGDAEVYKQFCAARAQVFSLDRRPEQDFPAASALGGPTGTSVIYVLSARHPGRQFSNHAQVDAYRYPRQYGPRSPSFSRATRIDFGEQALYLISGTASILGHRTAAPSDFSDQLEIAIDNMERMLAQADIPSPQLRGLKVYLRDAADLQAAQIAVGRRYPAAQPLFLRADICRSDLLVELECHVESMRPADHPADRPADH